MNDYISMAGGTVVVGFDYRVDFTKINGPIVVITDGAVAEFCGPELGNLPHLTDLYLEGLSSAVFLELLLVKDCIRVGELSGQIEPRQLDWFVNVITNTDCVFAVTVAFEWDRLPLFALLEGQSAVRAYPIGDPNDHMALVTNDPDVDLETWEPFVLFETEKTIVFSHKHRYSSYRDMDHLRDLVVQPHAFLHRGPVSIPPSKELHLYMCYLGSITMDLLKRPFDRLVVHLIHPRDLSRFKVEDLHPKTKSVQIHGCSPKMQEDLNKRTKERSVSALFALQINRLATKSELGRAKMVIIAGVAEML